jgi:hypothetical protein
METVLAVSRNLVHDPAERLREIFENWKARFVVFVEALEYRMTHRHSSLFFAKGKISVSVLRPLRNRGRIRLPRVVYPYKLDEHGALKK